MTKRGWFILALIFGVMLMAVIVFGSCFSAGTGSGQATATPARATPTVLPALPTPTAAIILPTPTPTRVAIPLAVAIDYIETSSAKGRIGVVKTEATIANKGMPNEQWVVKATIKNVSTDTLTGYAYAKFSEGEEFPFRQHFELKEPQTSWSFEIKLPYEANRCWIKVEIYEYEYRLEIRELQPEPTPYRIRDIEIITHRVRLQGTGTIRGATTDLAIKNIADTNIIINTWVRTDDGSGPQELKPGEAYKCFPSSLTVVVYAGKIEESRPVMRQIRVKVILQVVRRK